MRIFTRRTFLTLLAASLLLLTSLPSLHAAAPAERSARLTILQLNDMYDFMPVEKGKKGGLARIAMLRDRIAKESPNLVFVLAGDFLSPSTMSSIFQGSQMVAGLNAVGLDFVTFGNHEFDFGEAVTGERMRESRFTWVSSNVLDPATGVPFAGAVSFALREYDGIRVAFIGLTTPETRTLSKGGKNLVTDEIPDQPRVAALMKQYEGQMAAQLNLVAGATSTPLDTRNEIVRVRESPVGNLIADLLREAVQADVALVNGGGIRGNAVTPAGSLTRGDVLRILPFANKIVKLDLTGATLRAALENGLSQIETTAGRFPQVSGLRFTFDPKKPAGYRLVAVTVGDRPLDPAAHYTLATFEFLLGGGDGYAMLKEGKVLVNAQSGPMDLDLVLERLKAGPIAPATDGRIQVAP